MKKYSFINASTIDVLYAGINEQSALGWEVIGQPVHTTYYPGTSSKRWVAHLVKEHDEKAIACSTKDTGSPNANGAVSRDIAETVRANLRVLHGEVLA